MGTDKFGMVFAYIKHAAVMEIESAFIKSKKEGRDGYGKSGKRCHCTAHVRCS